jgi:hypothetical protein
MGYLRDISRALWIEPLVKDFSKEHTRYCLHRLKKSPSRRRGFFQLPPVTSCNSSCCEVYIFLVGKESTLGVRNINNSLFSRIFDSALKSHPKKGTFRR